jgi:hypothetical protein
MPISSVLRFFVTSFLKMTFEVSPPMKSRGRGIKGDGVGAIITGNSRLAAHNGIIQTHTELFNIYLNIFGSVSF